MTQNPSKLVLVHRWALGDTVIMTALVRDIHRMYPGKYLVMPLTNWQPVWNNNPYISRFETREGGPSPTRVQLCYRDGIRASGRGERVHFLRWLYRDFEKKTGIKVTVTDPKPDLHLTRDEKKPFVDKRYWVIVSGGKLDMTTKHWEASRCQEVVDTLGCYGIPCVQVGATHHNHIHPPLDNCLNLVGKTDNPRDLFSLIHGAEGVICGVTSMMHIAASFNKPCVVIAGGREEWWWEAYTNIDDTFEGPARPVKVQHRFLHTLGLIYCCESKGCWKKRVTAIRPDDLTKHKNRLCKEPHKEEGRQTIPLCMDMITVNHVVEAVMSYYEDGTLQPIQAPSGKYPKLTPGGSSTGPQDAPEALSEPPLLIRIPSSNTLSGAAEGAGEGSPKRIVASSRPALDLVRDFNAPLKAQQIAQRQMPAEIAPDEVIAGINYEIMDHPTIGGQVTFCTLCYGPHTDLAKRCLTSVLETVPAARLDIRVATNDADPETVEYLQSLSLTKLYINRTNRKKYPVMREMFWDESCPIKTSYVVWFDDDSFVVHAKWLTTLCQSIIDNHRHGSRLYGIKFRHDLSMYNKHCKPGQDPADWFREADWYAGHGFRTRNSSAPAPNGSIIDFVAGGFMALGVDAIRRGNIPDKRLLHNGGDITIGEQVRQAGFKIKMFNKGKSHVHSSGHERRGFHERFQWDPRE